MVLLINSKLRRKLLTFSFAHPDESFYVRELAVLIDEDPGNVSRELRRLEEDGFYRSAARGNIKFYSLNTQYPLFKQFKEILSKTEGIEGSLAGLVKKYPGISLAFIYGSYAQGKEKKGSDIDLVLVGGFPQNKLTRQIRQLESQLSREINFTSYTPQEFDKERRKDGVFLNLILKDKIVLLKGKLDII